MKKSLATVLLAVAFTIWAPTLSSAQTVVDDVRRACQTEIQAYCNNVTPGEGRVLACFYAHGGNLTPQCEYALFDAAARLERAIAAITYVANECENEIDTYCSKIQPGGGHIAECLVQNESNLGKSCNAALSDVGVK